MKKSIQAITLLFVMLITVSCSWDLNPDPKVTVEKIEDISDGVGKIVLHFEPAVQQDIILKTESVYFTDCETVTPGQIEIPAWAKNVTINFRVIYNPKTDVGLQVTFKITQAYGECLIGEPSEATLTILR